VSFGLGHGRPLDDAPGVVGIAPDELPPLPDEVLRDPGAGRLDVRRWFSDPPRPLEIEIGSGKGAFLLAEAPARPHANFLGIEWAREFYMYAADRIRRRGLRNVRMLNADAAQFLRWRVPDGVVRTIHLYFPDPWPKTRHHKKRIVRNEFLADAHRVLEPGGLVRIVTDHDGYWARMEEHFALWCSPQSRDREGAETASPRFERLEFSSPESVEAGELVGTNFERKYRREGRPFHACTLRKPPAA